MKDKITIKILLTPNLCAPVELVFDDVSILPFISTELQYINKTKSFEGIPCHICTINDNNMIFIINSTNVKYSFLFGSEYNDMYEIKEDDMFPIEDMCIE